MHLLRENLNLTGTHVGCDTSQCGACVVHVDGRAVKSCTMLAGQADGASVTTIEGIAKGDELHPMQAAFRDNHGLQCGYCTPGMIMSAIDIVNRHGGKLDEAHGPAGARRQYLPLHRLPQHRQGGAGRGRPHEGLRRRPRNSGAPLTSQNQTPPGFEGKRGIPRNSGREDRTWVLKALAQASCARKTSRFITGKGRYVDDIKLVGLTHAHFIAARMRMPW